MKSEWLLTDEEIVHVILTEEEYSALNRVMELYEPACFKGSFFNDEYKKIRERKISLASTRKAVGKMMEELVARTYAQSDEEFVLVTETFIRELQEALKSELSQPVEERK